VREVANTNRVFVNDDYESVTEGVYIVSQKEPFLLDAERDITRPLSNTTTIPTTR
jgi:hypothetical protein